MSETDRAFTGSVPDIYDQFMGPTLFEPYARDLARRYAGFTGQLLETAAGTGRLTRALAEFLGPEARITATDLSEPMLDDLDANDFCRVMTQVLEQAFPHDPPGFLKRGPFSYHDRDDIDRHLKEAGFRRIEFETVVLPTPATSAEEAAIGLCRGSPLAAEVESRGPGRLPILVEAVTRGLREAFGSGSISGRGKAVLVTARS